ncbi:MAG: Spermidine/putrescine import ATP-binding protein PotA [Lentisphaerae bacterium ADurb.BinA184]|nr:MAG: Spermidine/putrescine import ATP-binding protein PotA [Lentisphaerae bacterium ADurb.BinA184]
MTDIRLANLTKLYGAGSERVRALDDVNLRIQAGEFFFLLGPSGCGKTTLLRIIAGLVEPSAGQLFFGAEEVTGLPVERRGTAMVFQSYALWPHMTVQANVEFGPRMQGLKRAERRRQAQEALARVQMSEFARRRPRQLSGGQQQRVALARALAARPACLLLDEPLSNLDAQLRLQMRQQLRALVKATGTTGIYVTHDQKEALSMADRIAVMRDGRIVQTGTPRELYESPVNRFVADFIGEANFLRGTAGHRQGDTVTIETVVGPLRARAGQAVASGTAVECCVRPERITIVAAGGDAAPPDGECRFRATVESVSYQGELVQYVCRLGEGVSWKVLRLAEGQAPLAVGSAVCLVFPAAAATLLPVSEGPPSPA